ncbi:hypothetical protein [Ascidiimonas aurantiaca]|uniref:hypothetical protein n=1 Tax=Ascidiimonas aurantiaca TaxID=1685432 RepID=UPI0030ECE734
MKKKSLQQLALKKRTISSFSNSVKGGEVASSYPTTRPTPTITEPLPTVTRPTITVLPITTTVTSPVTIPITVTREEQMR